MGFQTVEAIQGRRRTVRVILFLIIVGTLPFYCAGFLLWGTARQPGSGQNTSPVTFTPLGAQLTATNTGFPTITPIFGTLTSISPLLPTPLQFIPPIGGGGQGNNPIPTATSFGQPVIPTATLAPTLTPFPTNAPQPTLVPPSNTPLPLPTDTPLPPLPTDTPLPPPSDTPLPFPTDVPLVPTDVPTVAP